VYRTGYLTATADKTTTATKHAADDGPTVLLSCSLVDLSNLFSAVSIFTVALTFAIATADGKVHPASDWPFLSDLWADKPTNMISRYFVCLGAGIVALEQGGHYFLAAPARTAAPKANLALHALSLAALLGLSGVGACNEKELWPLHEACATLFFGGFGAYMLIDALWMAYGHARGHPLEMSRTRLTACGVLAVAFNTYKLADVAYWLGLLPTTPYSAIAVLEWTAWVAFLLYARFHVNVYPDAPTYHLAIVRLSRAAPTALSSHTASLLQSHA
jgi:hypothetical protein